MKIISKITSTSNHKILRNGKILSHKNTLIKKKNTVKIKFNDQLSFDKTSLSNLNDLHVQNKSNKHEITKSSKYNNLLDSCKLCLLQINLPLSINNKVVFDDLNNNSNRNGYKNLENVIGLNEIQIYDKIEPKIISKSELKTNNKNQLIPKSSNKNNELKSTIFNHSITDHNIYERITRGKAIKIQTEERRKLDKIMFDKFPENTFKMFVIQLDDIGKEVEFLKKLGLTSRFKCLLSACKMKKKTS